MSKGGKREGAGRRKGAPNKATAEIKALAQQHTPAMITELVRIALHAESEQARVAAIKEVLDRGHGKSPQAVTVDPSDKAVDFMKELMALIDGQSRGLPVASGEGRASWLNG